MKSGSKRTERAKLFVEHFMEKHRQGFSVKEISEMYGITDRNGYLLLGEIAEKNGVTREELLQRPIEAKKAYVQNRVKPEKVNSNELKVAFDEAITTVDQLITLIDAMLAESKED